MRGEGGQLEAGGPSFGAGSERGHLGGVEVQSHDVTKERVGFVDGEPEVPGADFEELSAAAEAGQRKIGVGAGRDGDGRAWWEVVEQEGDGLVHFGGRGEVVVVEGEDDRAGDVVDVVDQRREGVDRRRGSVGVEHRLCRRTGGSVVFSASGCVV